MATLGKTDIGASNVLQGSDALWFSKFTATENGEVTSITAYGRGLNSSVNVKFVLVASDNTIVTNGITNAITPGATNGWHTATFSTNPTIVSGNDYFIGLINNLAYYLYYDTGTTGDGENDSSNSYASPTNPTDAVADDNQISIYATYTPTASRRIFVSG